MHVKVIGLSGSPVKGNTDILVNECLNGARELPDVETEFIHLADLKLEGPCIACIKCVTDPVKGKLCHPYKRDDLNNLTLKLLDVDGYIFGSPTYFGGESSLMKVFIDRYKQGTTGASKEQGSMLNKPFGVVTCGNTRHGGQELTIFRIMRAFMFGGGAKGGMIPVTPLVTVRPEGAAGFFGVTGQQGYPNGVPDLAPGYLEAVRQDKGAMKAANLLGKRVAETAKIIKAGTAALNADEFWDWDKERWQIPSELVAEAWGKSV